MGWSWVAGRGPVSHGHTGQGDAQLSLALFIWYVFSRLKWFICSPREQQLRPSTAALVCAAKQPGDTELPTFATPGLRRCSVQVG